MKSVCVLALFALVGCALAGSGSVVELNGDNFDDNVGSGVWLVKFFAPWCGHCKRMAPEFVTLAEEVKDNDVGIAEVDCTQHKELCGKYGVRGYPTVKSFKDGEEGEKHSGKRTAPEFRAWLNTRFPELNIKTDAPEPKEEVKEAANEGDVAILGASNFEEKTKEGIWLIKFYAPWCGHCKRLAPTWSELATAVKGQFNVAKVDCTIHGDLCSKHGIRGYPTLKMFEKGEITDYSGARDLEAFKTFLNENKKGGAADAAAGSEGADSGEIELVEGVPALTDGNFETAIKEGKWLVKFYAPWCGHCKRMAPAWSELAGKLKEDGNKFNNAKVDCTVHKALCSKFGVRGYPTIKYFEGGEFAKDYSGARDVPAFLKFFEDQADSHSHEEL